MRTLSIDEKSIASAAAGQMDLELVWRDLKLPPPNETIKCVEIDEHGFILSRAFQPRDALLTISLKDDGPLTALPPSAREEAFARLLRCTTLLVTGRARSVPVAWRSFHSKNRLTFQADRLIRAESGGRTNAGRIVLEISNDIGPRVFAFLLDRTGVKEIDGFEPAVELLRGALSTLAAALAYEPPEQSSGPATLGNAVALDGALAPVVAPHLTADDWYTSRLTLAQRQFVDHPMTGSVRLVGPAGSGKTVALVVKCVRELRKALESGTPTRYLFLTHSSATALATENQVLSMEPTLGYEWLASDRPALVIETLYSLANRQMRYDLDQLTPVSLDGHEGRTYQADELNDVIEAYRLGDWIAFRSVCTAPFVAYMEADRNSVERRFFLWEVLNEFACVLDAEGIRSSSARREQYLSEKRKSWMMVLASKEEREVILALYDRFRSALRAVNAIGGDQMITDFLNHLDSFKWEATREKEGYDVVFVDELHLFNRQERLTLRHLLRSPDAPPLVFMAYDAKQSPRDTFLKLPSADALRYDLWRDAKLGKVEKIELVDVFRYSPQIAALLSIIDQAFPGQDLDDDWPSYSGFSRSGDGPLPLLCTLKSTVATYSVVFQRAAALQRERGRAKRVAVLCASTELFKRYLNFSELRETFHAITSREEASGVPVNARRFVYSMPEYVAGLQFDTVLLIDVNRGEVPDGPYASAALRKFASVVYLGASRAERRLELYASSEHGGAAPLLSRAVVEGAIKSVEPEALRVL